MVARPTNIFVEDRCCFMSKSGWNFKSGVRSWTGRVVGGLELAVILPMYIQVWARRNAGRMALQKTSARACETHQRGDLRSQVVDP